LRQRGRQYIWEEGEGEEEEVVVEGELWAVVVVDGLRGSRERHRRSGARRCRLRCQRLEVSVRRRSEVQVVHLLAALSSTAVPRCR
jgi:hypothetical protein